MAYKTFQNGFPLPASDLNNYLMNQSVIVFADVAARTAALPTPVEGMITYLESDNLLYKWTGADWELVSAESPVTTEGDLIVGDAGGDETRLPIGANGSLLYSDGTDPSWLANSGTEGDVLAVNATGGLEFVTPSGGGGMTLISSTSLSGSEVSLTSIPQTYKELKLYVKDWSSDVDAHLRVRFNADTGLNYMFTSSTVTGAEKTFTSNRMELGSTTNASAVNNLLVLAVPDYTNTTTWKFCYATQLTADSSDPTKARPSNLMGATNQTSAISSIQVFTSSGSWDTGTVELYGVG